MFKIFRAADGPVVDMENGRGTTVNLVDGALGAESLDVHINRLVPGGPRGRVHRHSRSDNVYIVKRGEGTLTVEDDIHTIREDDVVFIPAGMRHSLSNLSEDPLELFEIYAPAGAAFDFLIDD